MIIINPKKNGWETGYVNGRKFGIKRYDRPSPFGIDGGRISKLYIKFGREMVNYERGWDEKPKNEEQKKSLEEILKYLN